jgi:hypothetical protein
VVTVVAAGTIVTIEARKKSWPTLARLPKWVGLRRHTLNLYHAPLKLVEVRNSLECRLGCGVLAWATSSLIGRSNSIILKNVL